MSPKDKNVLWPRKGKSGSIPSKQIVMVQFISISVSYLEDDGFICIRNLDTNKER